MKYMLLLNSDPAQAPAPGTDEGAAMMPSGLPTATNSSLLGPWSAGKRSLVPRRPPL